jgi:hypothetical protein
MRNVWFEYLNCAAGRDPHFQYQFHMHSAPSKPLALRGADGAGSGGLYGEDFWFRVLKMKIEFIAKLANQLPSDSTIFFLDVDVIVFRPLSEALPWVPIDGITFLRQTEVEVNTGFYALRSGPSSIAMLDAWLADISQPWRKAANDQSLMNVYLRENPQMKHTFPWEIATISPTKIFRVTVAYHAVGVTGSEAKLARLATAASNQPGRQADSDGSESRVRPAHHLAKVAALEARLAELQAQSRGA